MRHGELKKEKEKSVAIKRKKFPEAEEDNNCTGE